jgi:hypothetical protein
METMTTTKHLVAIKAECEILIAEYDKNTEPAARKAVAGWRSTIVAINRLAYDQTGNKSALSLILAAWPKDLLR